MFRLQQSAYLPHSLFRSGRHAYTHTNHILLPCIILAEASEQKYVYALLEMVEIHESVQVTKATNIQVGQVEVAYRYTLGTRLQCIASPQIYTFMLDFLVDTISWLLDGSPTFPCLHL